MPIEIRVLVIRAVVEERNQSTSTEPQAVAVQNDTEREALIQACVQQMMRILRRERER